MAFDMMENVGAGTPDMSWIDKLKGFGTSASESLQKDPGMWSTLLGELAPLVAPDNPLVVGAGKIGSQFGKAKTLMTAEQARVAKEDERTKAILAAIQAGPTDITKRGINSTQDKFNPKTGLMDTTISLNLADAVEAGNINTNVPGNISLDQGPTMESLAAPGTDQTTRKGFDIRPFFQP